jgi:hypothetical protein
MIHFASVILAALLPFAPLESPSVNEQQEDTLFLTINSEDYTNNRAKIEQIKRNMLAMKDESWRSGGEKIDPHTAWLVNRAELMSSFDNKIDVDPVDYQWAWMLAVTDCIKQYNQRLGRKVGSVRTAVSSVYDWLEESGLNGNNVEMAGAKSRLASWEYYKLLYKYYILMESSGCKEISTLNAFYYHELRSWIKLSATFDNMCGIFTEYENYGSGIVQDLIYNGMSINEQRSKILDEELRLIANYNYVDCYGYYSESYYRFGYMEWCRNNSIPNITIYDVHELIKYLKNLRKILCVNSDIVEDAANVRECAAILEKDLKEWYSIRKCIEGLLPEYERSDYSQLTQKLLSFYYGNLKIFKEHPTEKEIYNYD